MNTSLETTSLTEECTLNEFVFSSLVATWLCRRSPYSVSAHPSACGDSYQSTLNCKHIFRMITYSINAHPVIALMFSQTGTDVLPRRDEGSDKPSATIEPHRIIAPSRTRTRAAGLKVRCRNHYTTATHMYARTPCVHLLAHWLQFSQSALAINFFRVKKY